MAPKKSASSSTEAAAVAGGAPATLSTSLPSAQSTATTSAADASTSSAPNSPSKHKKRPWYSSDSLLAARLPIGFVMHIGAHLLTVYYSIVVQLVVVPLMYWELSQEFPKHGRFVQVALTSLSLLDLYLLWYHPEINIWQVALGRFVLTAVGCILASVNKIDNIIVNYLMVGLTCGMYLLSKYSTDVFLAIAMSIAGSDCMQYFTGKLVGRTKIVPKISPNKSLEGYIGAFIGCNLIFYFWLAEYSVLTLTQALIYVNGMLLAGILGDLFISWWKRNHHLKDTSSLLLAHGGVLDRLDSHMGAWIWTLAFITYFGIPEGVNFTAMIHENIIWLIVATWTALWTHFFVRRLFPSRKDD